MPHTLLQNTDFFIAALSGTFISAWQLDHEGMYAQVGLGRVTKFTDDYIRIVNVDGSVSIYDRAVTKFHRK